MATHSFRGKNKGGNNDITAPDSSIWFGKLPDGDYVVGFFNREETNQTYSISMKDELGILSGCASQVRDLWKHENKGAVDGKITVSLRPHSCTIYRVTPSASQIKTGFGCTRR